MASCWSISGLGIRNVHHVKTKSIVAIKASGVISPVRKEELSSSLEIIPITNGLRASHLVHSLSFPFASACLSRGLDSLLL